MNSTHPPRVRCSIYTRKSSEEGLEQAFNSLDAQRESCAAYILSQASEGWICLPDIYDDGGLSGGTLERPALQRLLAEVREGRIDIIVVYKVDRLTRSLLDFSKLVEAFDKAGTSFVSVTQSFNTTTSMGRLTLNMLLSFAQFEREVTAERIRDKIAASKAKGMWMGGTPPLGYQPDGRSLKIVEDHADIVRDIFARYLSLGNVRLVADALELEDISTPTRIFTHSGRSFGGVRFSRGQIYSLLKCPTYIGEIRHNGQVHQALHPPIVARDVWDRTQAMLAANLQGTTRVRRASLNLLAGKLVDAEGELLVAVHAMKGNTRYRYYVSHALHHKNSTTGMRIPALEIETAVCQRISALLGDALLTAATAKLAIAPDDFATFTERCGVLHLAAAARHEASMIDLISQVCIHDSRIDIMVGVDRLAEALKSEREADTPGTIVLRSDIRLTRSGRAMRLVQGNGIAVAAPPDRAIINLLVKARHWWALLREGELNVMQLAARHGLTDSYVTRVVRMAFLSPKIVEALIAGQTPIAMNRASLLATGGIAPHWGDQETILHAHDLRRM